MIKDILLSGLLGGLVFLAWLILSTGPLPLNENVPGSIPNDKEIHSILKERITEPGIYFLPDHPEEGSSTYPDYGNEPVFSIIYGGRTPDRFMGQLIFELICFLIAPMIAAWLLSMASERILTKYFRRVLFVTGLGLFLAVFGEAISDKPLDKILLTFVNNIIT